MGPGSDTSLTPTLPPRSTTAPGSPGTPHSLLHYTHCTTFPARLHLGWVVHLTTGSPAGCTPHPLGCFFASAALILGVEWAVLVVTFGVHFQCISRRHVHGGGMETHTSARPPHSHHSWGCMPHCTLTCPHAHTASTSVGSTATATLHVHTFTHHYLHTWVSLSLVPHHYLTHWLPHYTDAHSHLPLSPISCDFYLLLTTLWDDPSGSRFCLHARTSPFPHTCLHCVPHHAHCTLVLPAHLGSVPTPAGLLSHHLCVTSAPGSVYAGPAPLSPLSHLEPHCTLYHADLMHARTCCASSCTFWDLPLGSFTHPPLPLFCTHSTGILHLHHRTTSSSAWIHSRTTPFTLHALCWVFCTGLPHTSVPLHYFALGSPATLHHAAHWICDSCTSSHLLFRIGSRITSTLLRSTLHGGTGLLCSHRIVAAHLWDLHLEHRFLHGSVGSCGSLPLTEIPRFRSHSHLRTGTHRTHTSHCRFTAHAHLPRTSAFTALRTCLRSASPRTGGSPHLGSSRHTFGLMRDFLGSAVHLPAAPLHVAPAPHWDLLCTSPSAFPHVCTHCRFARTRYTLFRSLLRINHYAASVCTVTPASYSHAGCTAPSSLPPLFTLHYAHLGLVLCLWDSSHHGYVRWILDQFWLGTTGPAPASTPHTTHLPACTHLRFSHTWMVLLDHLVSCTHWFGG